MLCSLPFTTREDSKCLVQHFYPALGSALGSLVSFPPLYYQHTCHEHIDWTLPKKHYWFHWMKIHWWCFTNTQEHKCTSGKHHTKIICMQSPSSVLWWPSCIYGPGRTDSIWEKKIREVYFKGWGEDQRHQPPPPPPHAILTPSQSVLLHILIGTEGWAGRPAGRITFHVLLNQNQNE